MMKSQPQDQSIPLVLAVTSRLSLVLALLLLTPMPPVAEPLSTSGTRTAVNLEQPQLPDCPLERIFQVMIDDEDMDTGEASSNSSPTVVTLHLVDSSADFLHSSERTGGGGRVVDYEGRQLESRLLPPCFYQGSVEGEDGLAAAKERDGFISGRFHHAGRIFEIPEQSVSSGDLSPLRSRQLPPALKTTSNVSGSAIDTTAEIGNSSSDEGRNRRKRRALMIDSHAEIPTTSMKYILLILVGDQSFYHNQRKDMAKAQERLWEIGNYVNALYKQLGINVITVYTEVWKKDPYVLDSAGGPSGVDFIDLFNHFELYRRKHLRSKIHSVAHLISGLKFNSNKRGYTRRFMCTLLDSVSVNADRDRDSYSVAVAVAQHLGVNLGLDYEGYTNCSCPDAQGCIMNIDTLNPVHFSNCSMATVKKMSSTSGVGYCISDPPNDAAVAGVKVMCGNGIVEAGEECDCGPAKLCKSTCCNPATCKFKAGAACASGECCNQATCKLKSEGTMCRAKRDVCDLAEFCNGTSEWCPQIDGYKADGTECVAGKAYCYKGRCGDRDTRCGDLFNKGGFRSKSAPASVSALTLLGNSTGYCSYTYAPTTKTNPPTYHHNYTYTACTEANQRCGVLYCTLGYYAWDMQAAMSIEYHQGNETYRAHKSKHDLTPSGYRDPAMVPNGAECGTNMMCVDSKCVSTGPEREKEKERRREGERANANNPRPGDSAGVASKKNSIAVGKSAGPLLLLGLGLMVATTLLNFQWEPRL